MAGGNKGYIWLHRELQDNPLWNSEPFSKGQAWVDMLLRANHQRNEFIIGNELIVVERGQFFTSELKLAEKWKWSRKKVRAYLSLLKTLKMATTVGTSKGTMVTIENYALYQHEGTTKDTTVGTSKEHRRNIEGYTNKNDKELIKNDKEIKTEKPDPIPYQEIVDLYNEICVDAIKCIKLTDSRKKQIALRYKELGGIELFEKAFNLVQGSSFLTGKNDRNWKVDIPWLIKNDSNIIKVLEGKYKNDKPSTQTERKTRVVQESDDEWLI